LLIILTVFRSVINESATGKNSGSIIITRSLTIKQDVNGLLDIARATFCEYVDLLEEYVQVLFLRNMGPPSLKKMPNIYIINGFL
jgi:hypothetical protein